MAAVITDQQRKPSGSFIPGSIDPDPENMAREIDASERRQKEFFSSWDRMVGRYATEAFNSDVNYKNEGPENHAFEWIATMGAQFVAGVPQYGMRSRRTDDPIMQLKAAALKHSTNRWAIDTKLKRLLKKLWTDWCFRRASAVLSRRPSPANDRGPRAGPSMKPFWSRISPPRLRLDPRALDWDDRLWTGHPSMCSKQALKRLARESKGWDLAALDKLQVGSGEDQFYGSGGAPEAGTRDDVMVYQIWFPDEQLDEDLGPENGFHGVLRWYAHCEATREGNESKILQIKEAEAWFGPQEGPYRMSGQYYVPDNVEPLSVLVAIEHIAKSMAIRAKVVERAMSEYKRIIIEGTGTRNLGLLVKNANHNSVVKAKGFNRNLASEFVIGGLDAPTNAAYQWDLDRQDRRSGLTSTQRGEVKPGATATAEAYAAAGTSGRAAGLRDEFYEFVLELGLGAAEVMDMDPNFRARLDPEAVREMGVDLGGIQGGRKPGESFEDYELWCEPLSMQYRTEPERQAVATMELEMFEKLTPLIPQAPWCDWRGILEDLGEEYGLPHAGTRINYQLAEQVAGVFLGQAIQQGQAFQPGMARPRPVLAQDVSGGRAAAKTPPGAPKQRAGAAQGPGASPLSPAGQPGPRTGLAGRSTGSALAGRARSSKAGAAR